MRPIIFTMQTVSLILFTVSVIYVLIVVVACIVTAFFQGSWLGAIFYFAAATWSVFTAKFFNAEWRRVNDQPCKLLRRTTADFWSAVLHSAKNSSRRRQLDFFLPPQIT
ncbi:MAG: hypothetical protein WDN31_13735 [Hyphomicrobium sp.]